MIRWLQLQAHRLIRRYLRLNLRQRIAGAMLALVALAAMLMAVIAHFAGQRLEENVNYDLLAEELKHYEQRLRADPSAAPLASARLHIYRSVNLAELPREMVRLPPGEHRTVSRDGKKFRVLVRDGEFGRLYITYDVSEHERGQRIATAILVLAVAGILALTTWIAFRISQPLLGPVHRLASALSRIDPRDRSVRVADHFTGNELEPIARSIDSFLERLDGFVEREQAFTSTASHELRTPLSVIQGAVELLSDRYGAEPGADKALARIQRAVREMSDFTTALLSLARESDHKAGSDAACDIAVLLPRIIEDQRAALATKAISATIDPASQVRVAAPDSMAAMVIGNVIRNALEHGDDDIVRASLHGRQLTVMNHGVIANDALPHVFEPRFTTRAGGHGMGLYIARRICERYGWQLTIDSDNDTTTATVVF